MILEEEFMNTNRCVSIGATALLVVAIMACQQHPGEVDQGAGKIPVTTSSEEARAVFLEARELLENLRVSDARQLYLQAVEKDPEFASAHLGLANTATSASDFFSALARATDLAPDVSEGERLMINALAAGVNGEPERQRTLLETLLVKYPEDERAHNLIGVFYFGRQEWTRAANHLRRATEINPEFAPAYNMLGYSLRFKDDYAAAETAFKKYVELIPDEPNPYDSYAELLTEMGRFEESIVQYEKALEINQKFINSYVGIGNNLMLMGRFDEARESFRRIDALARGDGERRQAVTWVAISHLHQRDYDAALGAIRARYEIAEESDDKGGMAADLGLMGTILLYAGQPEAAVEKYDEAVAMSDRSNATDEVKEAVRRNRVANLTRVALRQGDLDGAKALSEEYRELVEPHQIPGEIRQSHELFGLVAIGEGRFQDALDELVRANQQDARVLFAQALALRELGQDEASAEMLYRAAHHNTLIQAPINYSLVRPAALEMLKG
jgi:tetratricopeptide (TPR) repeat protein